MDKDDRIYVAGHRGLVGSALVRRLEAAGYRHVLTAASRPSSTSPTRPRSTPGSRPRQPSTCHARRGHGRRHPGQRHPPRRLHPRQPADPDQRRSTPPGATARRSCCSSARPASTRARRRSRSPRSSLLTGPLEPTNEWYAIAKIAGIKLCQAYRRQYGFDFICGHADQPLRPGRQLRPHLVPRPARPDPQVPRGPARRSRRGRRVGHRHAAARVPPRRRPAPTPASS